MSLFCTKETRDPLPGFNRPTPQCISSFQTSACTSLAFSVLVLRSHMATKPCVGNNMNGATRVTNKLREREKPLRNRYCILSNVQPCAVMTCRLWSLFRQNTQRPVWLPCRDTIRPLSVSPVSEYAQSPLCRDVTHSTSKERESNSTAVCVRRQSRLFMDWKVFGWNAWRFVKHLLRLRAFVEIQIYKWSSQLIRLPCLLFRLFTSCFHPSLELHPPIGAALPALPPENEARPNIPNCKKKCMFLGLVVRLFLVHCYLPTIPT